MNEFTIYRTVAVPIFVKIVHIRWIGDRVRRAFTRDCGDLPFDTFNDVTGQWMGVENRPGLAYAARTRSTYRKNKKALLND